MHIPALALILLAAPLPLQTATPTVPPAAEDVGLYFDNGGEPVSLIVDPTMFGVRLDPALDEVAQRALLAELPGLAIGASDSTPILSGKTIYLEAASGLSAEEALLAAAVIRRTEGVLSASPRLWALEDPYYLTEEILVRWHELADPFVVDRLTSRCTVTASLDYANNPGVVYRVPHGVDPLALANAIAASGQAEFAIPDFQLLRLPYGTTNDTKYGDQWHLESTGQKGTYIDTDVDVEGAWDITRGNPAITVAVIDTGVALAHPDLKPNLVQGIDVLDDDDDPRAMNYLFGLITENHSTAVCGVASGVGNNNKGISGVAQTCTIMPIRFLSEWIFNQPTVQDEADAFNFAWQNGASVINNSWGPTAAAPLPASTRVAIDDATSQGRGGLGCVVFFAAGNSNRDMSNNGYASYGRCLAVSALNDQERLASYSSYGNPVDVCAPSNGGRNGITTTDRLGINGYSTTDYTDDFGGTSSASPCASGVMLLLLSANPTLTRVEATQILLETASHVGLRDDSWDSSGHSWKYGYGCVNAATATFVASGGAIDTITLTGTTVGHVNQPVSYQLSGAPANSPWMLLYSNRASTTAINGQPFGLGGSIRVAASGTTNGSGQASWSSAPLPPSTLGLKLGVEARVDSGGATFDSNLLLLQVQ